MHSFVSLNKLSLSQCTFFSCFHSSNPFPHPVVWGWGVTGCGCLVAAWGWPTHRSMVTVIFKALDGFSAHSEHIEQPLPSKLQIVVFVPCTQMQCATYAHFCQPSQSFVSNYLCNGIVQSTKKSFYPFFICQNSSGKCYCLQLEQYYFIRFSDGSFSSFNCSAKLQDFWAVSSFRKTKRAGSFVLVLPALLSVASGFVCNMMAFPFCASFILSIPATTKSAGNLERSLIVGKLNLYSLTWMFL